MQGDTPYPSVFSPNAAKYGPELLQRRTIYTQCYLEELKIRYLKIKKAEM